MRHLTGQKRPMNDTSAIKDKNGYLLKEKGDTNIDGSSILKCFTTVKGKHLRRNCWIIKIY